MAYLEYHVEGQKKQFEIEELSERVWEAPSTIVSATIRASFALTA